ncbi:MAG: flavodoxin [Halobacteriota archaeon]
MNSHNAKSLVAYFSRQGKNIISSGDIIDLPMGNTEVVAQMIQEATGSDSFRIEAVNPYPEDYRETTEVAKEEQRANARPELTSHVENMDAYRVVFVGYPNWWGTMPMPLFTFLEEYDLAGKTIAPFCTHEGSSLGRSVTDIKAVCPHSTVLDGLAVRGSDVQRAQEQVSEWLCRLGVIKR